MAPIEIATSVRIELVPAPAITAGIVKTPVPMMLPTTSAVAEVSPSFRAGPLSAVVRASDAEVGSRLTVVVMGPSVGRAGAVARMPPRSPRPGRRT